MYHWASVLYDALIILYIPVEGLLSRVIFHARIAIASVAIIIKSSPIKAFLVSGQYQKDKGFGADITYFAG